LRPQLIEPCNARHALKIVTKGNSLFIYQSPHLRGWGYDDGAINIQEKSGPGTAENRWCVRTIDSTQGARTKLLSKEYLKS